MPQEEDFAAVERNQLQEEKFQKISATTSIREQSYISPIPAFVGFEMGVFNRFCKLVQDNYARLSEAYADVRDDHHFIETNKNNTQLMKEFLVRKRVWRCLNTWQGVLIVNSYSYTFILFLFSCLFLYYPCSSFLLRVQKKVQKTLKKCHYLRH